MDNLTRIGKMPLPDCQPILGSENTCFYRNKLEFTFSNNRWLTPEELASDETFSDRDALGFHIPGMFDKVLDIRQMLVAGRYIQPHTPGNQTVLQNKRLYLF